ncbi:hypothetical protein SERLA73DRAFT_68112 [Serpula lacrymans var. lacrymans S7.3]|uniref:Uncharacterized protein n=2 Tax=Serpula lacrymans var. lacrymans TaxID=341189 RepID=F8PGZ1_SERL3|nr:uncharacterized protein SERLADRAFT_431841 [Serpula lacrymans var. lacrymans S7.9]EGO04428.1 hypothetical protein SERLA73DRAFT_68112 [Serpula lacrymans var. lacrymans S7.3]EGO30324.1 hypothetical protein SERLADRAFT_431841 [Serpula lacrymans var. lacrymans S7.9]
MSLQTQQDVNALLHNMRAQILTLIIQLAKLQANPPAATPSVKKKFNKEVEIVADPGTFEGDRAQFAEWWIKLQIWGPVAGRYTQVRLQECYTTGVWPTWDNLKIEIKKYFKPQAQEKKAVLASEAKAKEFAKRKRAAAMLADEEDSEGDSLHGKKICRNGDDNDYNNKNDNEDVADDDNNPDDDKNMIDYILGHAEISSDNQDNSVVLPL